MPRRNRFTEDQPPAGFMVRNQGGISERTGAPQPRVERAFATANSKINKTNALPAARPVPPPPGRAGAGGQKFAANLRKAKTGKEPADLANSVGAAPKEFKQEAGVPDKPVARTRQDGVERPVTSPSTTGAIGADGGEIPDGSRQEQAAPAGDAITREEQEQGFIPNDAGNLQIPGQEEPGSGLAQGLPGEGVPLNAAGMPMSAQEQVSQLTQEFQQKNQDTSGFLSGMEAQREQERARKAQPSPVEGVPQGQYEQVVKDDYRFTLNGKDAALSSEQKGRLKSHAEQQLREYGDYPGKNDPDAPAPPIRPGGRSFNPFTGSFTGQAGPNAWDFTGFDFEAAKREFFSSGGNAEARSGLVNRTPPPPGDF